MEEQKNLRLFHMIKLMDLSNARYHLDAILLTTDEHRYRRNSVKWINDVAHTYSLMNDTRDQAVQILDAFLTTTSKVGTPVDSRLVAYAAVTAFTFSFKLHETARTLRLSSFRDFDLNELKVMESRVLSQLAFNLTPQITPSGFVHELLHIWEPITTEDGTNHSCVVDKAHVEKVANGLIAEFWSEPSSMRYAPSTVAISATILAFSILHLDCSHWLASVPNCCLPVPMPANSSSSPLPADKVAANVRQLLDVDACLVSFARVPSLYETPKKARSAATTTIPFRHPISPTSKATVLSPEVHERSVLSSQSSCPSRHSRCDPTYLPAPPLPPTTGSATDAIAHRPDGHTPFEVGRMRRVKKRSLHADLALPPASYALAAPCAGDDDDDDRRASVRRRIAL